MGRQTSLSLPVDVGGNVSGKRAIETTEREWLRLSNSTVIERWIKAAVDYKSRVPGWPVNDSLQNRHLSYAQLAHYEYWWNSLFLQMGAFAEPLFFLDAASLSANYAGLGFVVARHLEKAFDLKWGAQLDVNRKKRNWMSSASRSAYEGKLACTGGNDRVLSHIVALEIALAAAFGSEMGHENGAEPKDLRYSLPLQSETFTSEMVFFLIYCRVTCGSTPGCGDVLRRVERFGKAFGVPHCSHPVPLFLSCTFEHSAVTFDSVGQNALWEANNYDKSKRVWHVHMRNWFAEHRSCPVKTIDSFRARGDGARIGHFTQLVWADTQYVGCGYSYYTLDGVEGDRKYQSFYVCNYAPTGNVFSMPVYQAGPACSSCPKGLVCDRFSGLCAVGLAFLPD
ncbi:hypothetical protein V5799_007084 [Amblyomma americanum]|uniref:SCP domain-containing protein n=1 Tax=Amblyomma americanum TaxID=6943 RepID=A0AAQ4DUJ5_AMBAM